MKESFTISSPPRPIEGFLLASVGGCIDAVGILLLGGLFVSHMSGNTAEMGELVGQGKWLAMLPHLYIIPVFLLGLFIGYVAMLHNPTFRRCGKVLAVEGMFLLAFLMIVALHGVPPSSHPGYYALITLPVLAMGMQNSTLREVHRSLFASTYVTGVLDSLAKALARLWLKSPSREEAGRTARQAAGIWVFYALGAIVGSIGVSLFKYGIVVLPIVVLFGLSWRFFQIKGQPPNAPAP